MPSTDLVFQLSGTCNNYDWGQKGKGSLAARLCARTPGTNFVIDEEKTYSEMWFGDYPDFPARVLSSGEPLADHLEKNQEALLRKKVVETLDAQLPYLPEILSIGKALPLQIHPNKALATKLPQKDPDQFSDPNHKPEVAVALSKFEVFAGWKPLSDITPLFTSISSLQGFVPSETPTSWTSSTLREVTRNVLLASESTVQKVQDDLASMNPADLGPATNNAYILDLLPRLKEQYGPTDPGPLVALLCMNYLVLSPSDTLYIPADGDIVECMARSNNVLNVGFCPRAERNSINMFCETLTSNTRSKDDVSLPKEKSSRGGNGNTGVYRPPLSEFDMLLTEEVIGKGEGPGVAIVTEGEGGLEGDGKTFDVKGSFIFFVAPGSSKGPSKIFNTVV
ncbi:RmlC-like cupin domain-containing protein [Pterulicium gracile]|uniref:Mannose-6-phosphate isomerase n=1 Tax=Pterulicium gracile TaxID=1884261 RepID=A0A5C3QFN2_9AGAR|nr:RmlC-like cupin domain-containing protein [Pterula gracilis]